MAPVGSVPRGAVIAEDVRDLQRWPCHGRGLTLLAGPLLQVRRLDLADRAFDGGDPSRGDTGIAGRRIELVMAEGPEVIMLTFYVIETEGFAERDQLLADAAGHSARDKRRYPPP